MRFKEFMNLFDNWNGITKVNDDKLQCIVKGNTYDVVAEREDLHNMVVVAFGFYDNELCVRVREETPSESPRKVNVFIEEHLCKRVEIEVPNEMNKLDAMKYAERKAKQMYKDEEIVLTADDFNGICLMMVQDEDGNETGWFEF